MEKYILIKLIIKRQKAGFYIKKIPVFFTFECLAMCAPFYLYFISYINISNYYLKNTKYKKCVKTLEEALSKQLGTKEIFNNLGIAYLATKENEKSKSMFEEALRIDPSYKPALDNLESLEKID